MKFCIINNRIVLSILLCLMSSQLYSGCVYNEININVVPAMTGTY